MNKKRFFSGREGASLPVREAPQPAGGGVGVDVEPLLVGAVGEVWPICWFGRVEIVQASELKVLRGRTTRQKPFGDVTTVLQTAQRTGGTPDQSKRGMCLSGPDRTGNATVQRRWGEVELGERAGRDLRTGDGIVGVAGGGILVVPSVGRLVKAGQRRRIRGGDAQRA